MASAHRWEDAVGAIAGAGVVIKVVIDEHGAPLFRVVVYGRAERHEKITRWRKVVAAQPGSLQRAASAQVLCCCCFFEQMVLLCFVFFFFLFCYILVISIGVV